MKYKIKLCSKCLEPKLIEKFPRGSSICKDCEYEPTSVCEACKQKLAVVYIPRSKIPVCEPCFREVMRQVQLRQGKSYVKQKLPVLSGTRVTGVVVDEIYHHEKD